MRESFSATVTEAMLDAFCSITGDVNPLYTKMRLNETGR